MTMFYIAQRNVSGSTIYSETEEAKKMKGKNFGINFCPHCGKSTENEQLNTPLGNGADWECSGCGKYVEAYILEH